MDKFTSSLNVAHVCPGDVIRGQSDGFELKATVRFDDDMHVDDDPALALHPKEGKQDPETRARIIAAREAWARDEWFYGGIEVSALKDGIELWVESRWGVEVNYPAPDGNAYLQEVANELVPAAVAGARQVLAKLCAAARRRPDLLQLP